MSTVSRSAAALALVLGLVFSDALADAPPASRDQSALPDNGTQAAATSPHPSSQPFDVAQASRAPAGLVAPRPPPSGSDQLHKERMNAWTLGLAAGRIEGAPLRFAAELARVLDDGDKMRVVPLVTRGIFDNVFDLLYLRGVDAAIVYGDVLDYFKDKPEFTSAARRINALFSLFPAEAHIFARPEITSLEDLNGRPVNFNTHGTAAAFSGPIFLKKLGINVKEMFIPHSIAMGKMKKSDEIVATVWVSSKPLAPFLRGKWPKGFHFLPIRYSSELLYYVPASLEYADYPDLIPQGQRIETIAVPAVLAVYDWPTNTNRYRRLVRLVDYLFKRFERLQTQPGFHPNWKNVSFSASVPGWTRFKPLQDRLDRLPSATLPAPVRIDEDQARAQAARAAPHDRAAQERLFREFLEWSRTRKGR